MSSEFSALTVQFVCFHQFEWAGGSGVEVADSLIACSKGEALSNDDWKWGHLGSSKEFS
jgi:hypothetical protein